MYPTRAQALALLAEAEPHNPGSWPDAAFTTLWKKIRSIQRHFTDRTKGDAASHGIPFSFCFNGPTCRRGR